MELSLITLFAILIVDVTCANFLLNIVTNVRILNQDMNIDSIQVYNLFVLSVDLNYLPGL